MNAELPADFQIRSPFTSHLGIEVLEAEPGRSRCRLRFGEQLRNRRGLVHGGAIFSLVDSAMGVAQHLLLDEGASSATLEIQIRYLRPVTDSALVCNARVLKKGSRVIFLEADVTVDGDIVATATGSYAITTSP